jgi:DNA recombination protein Rad52
MDWNGVSKELSKPLDSSKVQKPSGNFGPKGDYIEGWHAINEANRVFGFGGWSYTVNLTKDSLIEGTDAKGNAQWQACYTCVCTVVVDSVTRQDVGFGSGFSKNIGDAIEGATKEAVTDSLKRCLRTFGNPFGLALYDKTKSNIVDLEAESKALAEQQEKSDEFVAMITDGLPNIDTIADLKSQLASVQSGMDHLSKVSPEKHSELLCLVQNRTDEINIQQQKAA